jgi:hypothetical protein
MKMPTQLKMEHIDHDCHLITEAIRRLEESTWMLTDEDGDYSWYLFPKIRDSLNEHVLLEEQVLFPRLTTSECQRHRQHHRRFLLQLEMADLALRDQRAEHFQELLRCLAGILDEHHRQFKPPHNENEYICQCSTSEPAEQICARSSVHAL